MWGRHSDERWAFPEPPPDRPKLLPWTAVYRSAEAPALGCPSFSLQEKLWEAHGVINEQEI